MRRFSSEDPTVIPIPIPNDSTQGAARDPDAAAADECQLMAELSISFENSRFVFEGYRYDRLSDAVSYASHRRASAAPR